MRACSAGAKKKEALVSRGTRWKKRVMVVWDKGEDLTKWKECVIREDPVWMEEGPSETNVIFLYFYPTGLDNSLRLPQEISVSLFLELGRIIDGSMVSTLPSVISIGFALPSKKAKRLHSREIPPVTQSCNWIFLR